MERFCISPLNITYFEAVSEHLRCCCTTESKVKPIMEV